MPDLGSGATTRVLRVRAPVKSLQVADACGVLTPEQRQALGLIRCWRRGISTVCRVAHSWLVSPGPGRVGTPSWVDRYSELPAVHAIQARGRAISVAGYPAAKVAINNRNCAVAVEVSDQGTVFVHGFREMVR